MRRGSASASSRAATFTPSQKCRRSCRLPRRQAQARQNQLAVFRVPDRKGRRNNDRGECTQTLDDFARVIEPSHMGIACREKAVRHCEAGAFLDRRLQVCDRCVEVVFY